MDNYGLTGQDLADYNAAAGFVGGLDDEEYDNFEEEFVGARPNLRRALRQARRADRKSDRSSRKSQALAMVQNRVIAREQEKAIAQENTFDDPDTYFKDATGQGSWRMVKTIVPIGSRNGSTFTSVQSVPFTGKPTVTFTFTTFDDIVFDRFECRVLQSAANATRLEETLLSGIGVTSIKIGNVDYFESNAPAAMPLSAFLRQYNNKDKPFNRMVLEKSQTSGLTINVAQLGSGADGALGVDVDLVFSAWVAQVKRI